jgi:Fe-S cluster assembly scaffold protein SufB
MNKIILKDNSFDILNTDNKIDFEISTDYIKKIKIKVNKNTKLEIVFDNNEELKYEIEFNIKENVKCELIEIKKKNKIKILSKYNVEENSILNIKKINDITSINERNIINLNGVSSKVNCILKTVSKDNEKYDFVINHYNKETVSDITTHGVNINGNLYFNVTTYIPKGNIKSVANQNNRIINLTNNECVIRPNLLIDEYDITANHSALIGSFKDDEIFYMQRLGLDRKTANKLLIEGFLKSKLNTTLANNFKKYWR